MQEHYYFKIEIYDSAYFLSFECIGLVTYEHKKVLKYQEVKKGAQYVLISTFLLYLVVNKYSS